MSESKTLPLYSKISLESHNSKDDCWVSLHNRKVYNITEFLYEHPGGSQYLLDYAGKDITDVMKLISIHEHSESSYEILDENYLVGYLATDEEEKKLLSNDKHTVEVKLNRKQYDSTVFTKELVADEILSIATDYGNDFKKHKFLDLGKPLLPQVIFGKFSKDFYLDQVHRPRHYGKGSAPLFGNFLEPISKTPWYVIPIVWLPVVIYHIYVAMSNMNHMLSLFLFSVGLFTWTLIEYGLHRFLFHLDEYLPDHQLAFTLHFLLHGVHHYLPMDKYRLVMPPTLFLVLCTPFYKVVFGILPYYWACAGFAGGMFGYICYDLTHYFLHHVKLPKFMSYLKKYHLEHHYKNYELGFGVTSVFWDKIFGTYLDANAPVSKIKYE